MKRKNTKFKIIRAAYQEFSEHGFSGTTTRRIARRAKVNNSTLHYHWGTKEELYKAVFRDLQNRISEQFNNYVREIYQYDFSKPEGRRNALKWMVKMLINFAFENPNMPRLFAFRWLEEESYQIAVEQELMEPLMRRVTALLREMISQGYIREIDPELFVFTIDRILIGYFIGMGTQRYFLGKDIKSESVRQRIHAHLDDLVLTYLGFNEKGRIEGDDRKN